MTPRSSELEILDARRLSSCEIRSTFRFMAVMNAIGGARSIVRELRRRSSSWDGPITILDVASGGADIPRAIARWACHAGRRVTVVCVERSPDIGAYARKASEQVPALRFVRADAFALPFAARSFDYVISSLFFHHLSEDAAIAVLRDFDRLALRGIIVSDLIRRRRAVIWAWLLTRFGNAIVGNDGPLSVRRAYTVAEMQQLATRAGLSWLRARPVFGHHLVLEGDRMRVPAGVVHAACGGRGVTAAARPPSGA